LTVIWRTSFLIALPKRGTVAGAASVARVSRTAVYNLRADDPCTCDEERADAVDHGLETPCGFDCQVRAIIARYDAARIAERERQTRYRLQATA
jgi:hypothetical protein